MSEREGEGRFPVRSRRCAVRTMGRLSAVSHALDVAVGAGAAELEARCADVAQMRSIVVRTARKKGTYVTRQLDAVLAAQLEHARVRGAAVLAAHARVQVMHRVEVEAAWNVRTVLKHLISNTVARQLLERSNTSSVQVLVCWNIRGTSRATADCRRRRRRRAGGARTSPPSLTASFSANGLA